MRLPGFSGGRGVVAEIFSGIAVSLADSVGGGVVADIFLLRS